MPLDLIDLLEDNYQTYVKANRVPRSQEELADEICRGDQSCHAKVALVVQAAILATSKAADLGTAIAMGAETLVKGVFHPSLILGENRLFVEEDQREKKL